MNNKKLPRSVWVPALLLIYLFAMTFIFAGKLISNGETSRLIIVFCSELLLIALVHFFLKKREEQKRGE